MADRRHNPDGALLLAIDQGGHASRAIVFDRRGRPVACASSPITTTRAAGERVEHDAEEVVASVRAAIAEAVGALGSRGGDIAAAGLATQRSTIVCWDRTTGAALTPVISWQDRRAAAWLRRLEAHEETIRAVTGLVLSPHYGASKMRWCLDEQPDVAAAQRSGRLACGPLASFLLFRLLEERPFVADPVNASRTLLLDVATGRWSPRLLELFGLSEEPLPACVPNRYSCGTLRGPGETSIPLSVVTGDQPAALFADGEPDREAAYVNLGTGGFLQRLADPSAGAPNGLLRAVVWQDANGPVGVLEATINGAGAALAKVGAELGLDDARIAVTSAAWIESVRDVPLFLNGVAGLGAPFWRGDFESRFVGGGDVRARLAAVWESILFLVQVNLEVMSQATGAPRRLVLTGGLSGADAACRRLAALTGLPVDRPTHVEATARGLAYLLAERPDDWPPAGPVQRFNPIPDAALRDRYRRWRALMPAFDGC